MSEGRGDNRTPNDCECLGGPDGSLVSITYRQDGKQVLTGDSLQPEEHGKHGDIARCQLTNQNTRPRHPSLTNASRPANLAGLPYKTKRLMWPNSADLSFRANWENRIGPVSRYCRA